jgi:hypothetical protein
VRDSVRLAQLFARTGAKKVLRVGFHEELGRMTRDDFSSASSNTTYAAAVGRCARRSINVNSLPTTKTAVFADGGVPSRPRIA